MSMARVTNPPTACPPDTVLAAYLDFRLSREDRTAVELHVMLCLRCRDVVRIAWPLASAPPNFQ